MSECVLDAEDFIKQGKDDVYVQLSWCCVNERIEVNLQGVDVYTLLTETCIEALEEEYLSVLKPEVEGDDIDVPTYHELNQ